MKAVQYFLFAVYAGLLLLVASVALRGTVLPAEPELPPWHKPLVARDLETILADTLRILVLRDPLSWEERPQGVSGLEYDLMERFAKVLDVPFRVVPVDHPDSMLWALQYGRGDLIAAQATPRRDRRKWVSYSKPYRMVRPVLATLRADPQYTKDRSKASVGMAVDTAEVSLWSPFADPAYPWERRNGKPMPLHVDPLITPEDLLMEVVIGRHSATVITDARAQYEAGRFPVLEFSAAIGPEQPLCFVVRRNSPELLKRLDRWLEDPGTQAKRNAIVKTYASLLPKAGPLRTKRSIPVHGGDSISPYDTWFKEHAGQLPWDWELLAAMAFKESRFDSTVTSSQGAQGIMQIMPRTAERLGLGPEDDMGDHIEAAVRYLNKLDTLWMRAVPDRDQRLYFVLASYNSGPGHVIDAQRLAGILGLDPDRWEHNVERAMLLLAKPRYYMLPQMKNGFCNGRQVFHYVREVVGMYRQLKGRPRAASRPESSSMPGKGGE
jgi:membrane-bound lytic murein transglycosylase F